jgi:hypothetical protein
MDDYFPAALKTSWSLKWRYNVVFLRQKMNFQSLLQHTLGFEVLKIQSKGVKIYSCNYLSNIHNVRDSENC